MASINDYLVQLENLTQQNLKILQAINDSFFTKHNHLSIDISGQQFVMPSFISLENKINNLTANFNNLVHAPESGEAYFNMDGNSRTIEVRPYTQTPNSLALPNNVNAFEVEQNHVFKDFLTPTPYLKFDVRDIPNDITKVVVKKIIPLNQELLNRFETELSSTVTNADGVAETVLLTSKKYAYRNLSSLISNPKYISGIDYIEYDTVVDLPIRKNIGTGVYVIEQIISDITDENLDNYIKLKFRTDMVDNSVYMNDLKYRLFDEVIEKPLRIGDILTTFEGNAKVQIHEIDAVNNSITFKVLYGEYLNLTPSVTNDPSNISPLSKMKFFSPIDFSNDKYIKIPLEEDNLVFITVAALNSRMNVQSPWGEGVMLRTHSLVLEGGNQTFRDYYTNNVRNIGDILNEISMLNDNSLTKQNPSDFTRLTSYEHRPSINQDKLMVIQINSHLDNSASIKSIRSLHSLKLEQKGIMDEQLIAIQKLKDEIAGLPADDPDNKRVNLEYNLENAQNKYNTAFDSYHKYIQQITAAVNDTDIPIDNAKFRIRGYFDYSAYLGSLGLSKYINNVLSIQVQYRYKSSDKEYGTATRIDDNFTFSDWIEMPSIKRSKLTRFNSNSKTYGFQKQAANDRENEISWNQIEIPITQGETVDMRLRVMYDLGYPHAETYSAWSDTLNMVFPPELYKSTQILDIIEENNNDIQKNHFEGILTNKGVTQHINDKIITESQEIYFHDPKHIPSGFMTENRKIISLEEKLKDMQSRIDELTNEIMSSDENAIEVTVGTNSGEIKLSPFNNINIPIESYLTVSEMGKPVVNPLDSGGSNSTTVAANGETIVKTSIGSYAFDIKNGKASTIVYINITNKNSRPLKLFPLFPGMDSTPLNDLKTYKFNPYDYCLSYSGGKRGVYIYDQSTEKSRVQTTNQFLTFRVLNPSTQTLYYNVNGHTDTELSATEQCKYDDVYVNAYPSKTALFMYPYINGFDSLMTNNTTNGSYYKINAKETITIPIMVEYYSDFQNEISKTISFDLYPSLYKDPITFAFNIKILKGLTPLDSQMLLQRSYKESDRLLINMP